MNVASRVAAGATFMDSQTPGWFVAVDPDRLHYSDVLTQQFGGVSGGLIAHGLTRYQGVELGFLTQTGYGCKDGMTADERNSYNLAYAAEEEALLAAWADEVEARRSLAATAEQVERWEAMPL